MFKKLIMAIMISGCLGGTAYADGCAGVTTADGVTQEGVAFKAGYKFDEISIQGVNPTDDSVTWYAEAGGYVYPAKDVKLLNCHPAVDNSGNVTLAFNNDAASQSDQISDNTANELEQVGVDEADAGNWADYAQAHPSSDCAAGINSMISIGQLLSVYRQVPANQRDTTWETSNTEAQKHLDIADQEAKDDCPVWGINSSGQASVVNHPH